MLDVGVGVGFVVNLEHVVLVVVLVVEVEVEVEEEEEVVVVVAVVVVSRRKITKKKRGIFFVFGSLQKKEIYICPKSGGILEFFAGVASGWSRAEARKKFGNRVNLF